VNRALVTLPAVAVLALAGCGGSSKPAKVPRAALHGQVVTLAANPGGDLKYNRKALHAKPGLITIVFTNDSPEVHNVTVANGSGILGATPTFQGGSKALTLTLRAGTYKFYCSVPGHEAAGMKGTLVVGA
jgi:plastocyanin